MPEGKVGEGSQDNQGDKTPKMFTETEYVGVKRLLEKRESELANVQTQLAELQSQTGTLSSENSNLRTKMQSLEEQAEKGKAAVVSKEEYEKVVTELKTQKETQLQQRRDILVRDYKVDPEVVKGMTDTELSIFEKGIKSVDIAAKKSVPGMDLSSGGGLSNIPTDPLERARYRLEHAYEGK